MPSHSSTLSVLAVAATMLATLVRPADALPTWLHYVALPVHINGLGTNGTEAEELALPERRDDISHQELCDALVASARERGLPISFFTNLIWQESRLRPAAVSPVGAEGIAQFMPAVSKEMGFDPYDPHQAIPAAARLLRSLLDRFDNLGLAAAAYNAGPSRVIDWLRKRARLPAETRGYVAAITGRQADSWRARKAAGQAFMVPERMPCHQVATFAAAVRPELAEAARLKQAEAAVATDKAAKETAGRLRLAAARKKATPRVALKLRDKAKIARPSPTVRSAAQRKPGRVG